MNLVPRNFRWAVHDRNFLIFSAVIFLFQATTAFVLLSLIVAAFSKTDSNFAVSGVIFTFVSPAFFFTAIAGLVADLFDRRKILIVSNSILAVLVILMIMAVDRVYVLLVISFLYFAVNSTFLPTVSAVSAQLVPRTRLLASNSLFIFNLAVGQIAGFFASSIAHFFVGPVWNLIICEVITIILIGLSTMLPPLSPRLKKDKTTWAVIKDVFGAFSYILKNRLVAAFFIIFGFLQGIIVFGVTLGPGFFDDVVGISVRKSPIFALPMVALGAYFGITYVHKPKVRESFFVTLGLGVIGVAGLVFGILLNYAVIYGFFLLMFSAIFLIILGFGIVVSMIASRTVLQKRVAHNFQGSVFAAVIILGAFFASILSPLSAELEKLFGYVHLLIYSGLALLLFTAILDRFFNRLYADS